MLTVNAGHKLDMMQVSVPARHPLQPYAPLQGTDHRDASVSVSVSFLTFITEPR
jgi:hypothetical protein